LHIVDEQGSLYTQVMPPHDSTSLINHFYLFFSSITKRRNILLNMDGLRVEEISIEFYLLTKNKNRTFSVKMIEVTPKLSFKNFFNIQVLGNLDDKNQTTLMIYCQDHEFSSIEFGNELFIEVAKHVLSKRKSG